MTINFVATVNQSLEYVQSTFQDDTYIGKTISSFFSDQRHPEEMNVLVMSKSYYSCNYKNLYDNISIFVITNKSYERRVQVCPRKRIYFLDLDLFETYYLKYRLNVFVLGGGSVYDYFTTTRKPKYIYLILKKNSTDYSSKKPGKFQYLEKAYELIYYSEMTRDTRYIKYQLIFNIDKKNNEENYLDIVRQIIDKGVEREDRTNTGVYSLFGVQKRFDIKTAIPMLTTKRVPFKMIVEELLWFCRGDTDAKILSEKGIKIWEQNTSDEFLKSRNLDYQPGILGPGYGWQMRHSGYEYNEKYADKRKTDFSGGVDQLEYVVNLLKTDPFSRRIFISYWNPADLDKMALVPCHITIQFYVEVINKIKHLSCHFTMRSSDVFLGLPFNIMSYAILTHIIALKTDMVPHELIYSGGDVHLYKNHLSNAKIQIERQIRPSPALILNENIKHKDWCCITSEDFELVAYFPQDKLPGAMAV